MTDSDPALWQLWPAAGGGQPPSDAWRQLYTHFDRSRKHPWVMLNMVQSLNGATTTQGLSEGLSSPADRKIFWLLRSLADYILVGAGTVRLENYGPPRLDAEAQTERQARGQSPVPEMAVVTGGLSLDPSHRLFGQADQTSAAQASAARPIVLTSKSALAEHQRRAVALGEVAEVVQLEPAAEGEQGTGNAGGNHVDLPAVLDTLAQRAAGRTTPAPDTPAPCIILCEGGPTLNAQLAAQGLVDELCLSLSPSLVAGNSLGLLEGTQSTSPAAGDTPELLNLLSALTDGDMLFLRYGFTRA